MGDTLSWAADQEREYERLCEKYAEPEQYYSGWICLRHLNSLKERERLERFLQTIKP